MQLDHVIGIQITYRPSKLLQEATASNRNQSGQFEPLTYLQPHFVLTEAAVSFLGEHLL